MRKTTAALLLTLPALPALANPTGGTVASGSASVASNGSTMTVTQNSAHSIIYWTSFSIGGVDQVNFQQPSATAVILNRVTGSQLSDILGSLNANGRVLLVNPNGITFESGATVNVGSLVASTLDITD